MSTVQCRLCVNNVTLITRLSNQSYPLYFLYINTMFRPFLLISLDFCIGNN
jgi:hypothetical protein